MTGTVCFTTGTRIRTTRGEVAVEALRIGDEAVTASGALRPIAWIGHRDLDGAGRTLPHDQQPVRIRKGAFGSGLPTRDLRLSAGHPVLVGADADGEGGYLVPVMCLINGTTIAREPVAAVTYWHVELDSHDILLAEGLAAESYLDWGDRPFFTEASDHALHHPDFVVPGLSARCRPVAVDGPVVEAERVRLSGVFAAGCPRNAPGTRPDTSTGSLPDREFRPACFRGEERPRDAITAEPPRSDSAPAPTRPGWRRPLRRPTTGGPVPAGGSPRVIARPLTRRAALALLSLAAVPAGARAQGAPASGDGWRHGLSLLGEPKYPAGFTHFDYANPDAPKGGLVRFGSQGSFDNFNMIVAG